MGGGSDFPIYYNGTIWGPFNMDVIYIFITIKLLMINPAKYNTSKILSLCI